MQKTNVYDAFGVWCFQSPQIWFLTVFACRYPVSLPILPPAPPAIDIGNRKLKSKIEIETEHQKSKSPGGVQGGRKAPRPPPHDASTSGRTFRQK